VAARIAVQETLHMYTSISRGHRSAVVGARAPAAQLAVEVVSDTPRSASPDLSADRQRALEDGVDQPHLRPNRPPFMPTHGSRDAMSGDVVWQSDRHAVMVIDGYGYTQAQWTSGESPRWDIDRQDRWFDLEQGHDVPSDRQPEALPARYGVWHDGERVHLLAAEAGNITEIAVETTVADAVVRDLVADIAVAPGALERLTQACSVTTREVTEFTMDDLEALVRGEAQDLPSYVWADGPDVATEQLIPLVFDTQLDSIAIEEPVVDLADALWDL
jgi:hypothetical protein